MLPPVVKPGGLPLEAILETVPNLGERLGSSQGTKLSGGEQQMLAIAPHPAHRRAIACCSTNRPRGSRLIIIQQIGKDHPHHWKQQGFTILLVEQNFPLRLDGRGSLLRDGARPRGSISFRQF